MKLIYSISITLLVTITGLPVAKANAVQQTKLNNGNLVLEDIPLIPEAIQQQLAPLQNIRKAELRGWDDQRNSLYISTRFGQVNQLHRIQHPKGARYQLTFLNEPIDEAVPQPGGHLIALTTDNGGDENSSIWLLNTKTNQLELAFEAAGQNNDLVWSADGNKLAYRSTRRNGKSNDIWLLSFKDGVIKRNELLVKVTDGYYWMPMAFSANSEKLLVLAYQSATQSAAYQVSVTDKQLQPIAGADMDAIYEPVAYTQQGSSVFLLTDNNSQHIRLIKQNLITGKITEITKPIPWTVNQFTINHKANIAAFTINQHGFSQLFTLDLNNLNYQAVSQIPQGVIDKISFSAAGDKLAFSLESAQIAGDVFVHDLGNKQTKRWSYSEAGGLNPQSFVAPQVIEYPTFDRTHGTQRKVPALYYKPQGKAPAPVIISIHGGPEFQARPNFNSNFQIWIKELGAAIIAPNVRGSRGYGKNYLALDNGFKRQDAVKDIGALLEWIKTQPELDANRVAVIGMSYGGYMSLASAVNYSSQLKAAVDVVGISNFVTFLENTKAYRRDRRRAEYGDERDPAMRDFLIQASPLTHADKIKIPMLVVQGQNDPRVPVSEATQLVEKLRENSNPVWFMNALNEGHGYRKKENHDVYQQVTLMFFKRYLLGNRK